MTAWLFDLGNTRLKLAPMRDAGVGTVVALDHGDGLPDLPPEIRGDVALVATVAPEPVRVALLDALAARFHRIHLARTQSCCGPLRIAYGDPARLGVDRFLSMLALVDDCRDTLLVGVGTALTVDLLTADGRQIGGRIAPSPTLMRESLAARSTALPAGGGQYGEFAANTADALVSGCEGAALALVERSLQQAAGQLGAEPRLVMHGGGADALLPRLPRAQRSGHLVLQGLATWGRRMGVA